MLHCNDDNDPLNILVREEEAATLEEEQDRREEKQAQDRERIDKVLLPGDFAVYGLSAMSRRIGRSRQWLHYGIKRKYPELNFLQRNPLHAMNSSLQHFNCALVETRVFEEQQDRGRDRELKNKRPQVWHVSGPRSSR